MDPKMLSPETPKLFIGPRKDGASIEEPEIAQTNQLFLSRLPKTGCEVAPCGKCSAEIWIGPETRRTHKILGGNIWCPVCVITYLREETKKAEAEGDEFRIGLGTCGEVNKMHNSLN